jgi:hypothetical protein
MFNDDIFDNLPNNPLKAALFICESFHSFHYNFSSHEDRISHYNEYLEFYFAFEAYIRSSSLKLNMNPLNENTDRKENIAIISNFFSNSRNFLDKEILKIESNDIKQKYDIKFGNIFYYEFTDGDLKRIQQLINDLRDLVVASELFDANHKDRILKRLESLQRELNKRVSSIDKLWGLIGDAGVCLGKFGKDSKPFVDRILEITQIAWRTQSHSEELPSGTTLPLLTRGNKSDE